MRATDFEYRYQRLLHLLIVGVAVLTYLIWPDDIVWKFVRSSAAPHELERVFFIVAMLLIAAGAILCTTARAYDVSADNIRAGPYRYLRHPRPMGDFLYSIGLGSLTPLAGFVILVVGEALRLFRLTRREHDEVQNLRLRPSPISRTQAMRKDSSPEWTKALRQEAAKWGLVLTMILFIITLQDRLADILVAASLLLGLLFNAPFFSDSSKTDAST